MSEEVRICRSCLSNKIELKNLYENGLNTIYGDILDTLVSKGDGLPPYLCIFCSHLVTKFKLYREQCSNSESILKKIFMKNEPTEEVNSFKPIIPHLTISHTFHIDVPNDDNKQTDVDKVHNFEYVVVNEAEDVEIKKEIDNIHNTETFDPNIKIENLNFDENDEFDDDFNDDITLDQIIKNDLMREEKGDDENYSEEKVLGKRKLRGKVKMKKEKLVKNSKAKVIKSRKKSTKKAKLDEEAVEDDDETEVKEEIDEINSEKYRNAKLFYNYNPQQKLTKENLKKRIEMLDKFLRNYSVEVKFLSREEQRAEVERRKQYYTHLPYQCNLCNRGYSVEESYRIHMTTHDPTAGDYECDICGIRSKTRQDRRKHVNASHLKRFTCTICGKVTKSQSYAKAHYAQHGGTTYTCDQCDKKFTKKSNYLGHMRRVHKANAVDCPICADSFVGQFGLNLHMAMKHKQAVKCNSCDLLFDNAMVLSKHFENSTNGVCQPDIRACVRCGEGFPTEDLYSEHVREHHKKRRVNCEACDKTFSAEHNLALHWTKVHGDAPRVTSARRTPRVTGDAPRDINKHVLYMCDQCGKSFNIRTHFTLHMRLHTGEKPHQCPLCPKAFRLPLALKMHMLTHTDERPYRCALCPRAFRQSAHLHTHMRTHTLEKPHVCSVCHKAFSQVANMREHARTVHEGLPPRRRNRHTNVQ